jgi:hypothetical protein
VDTRPVLRVARAFRPREVAVTLVVLAALAFGIGAGIEILGLGRELAAVAAVAIVGLFVLVLLRGRTAHPPASAPPRPPSDPVPRLNGERSVPRFDAAARFDARADIRADARADAARAGVEPDLLRKQAVLEHPALRAEQAPIGRRTLTGDHPYAAAGPDAPYYLGVAGGAALALTLGGVLFLALPNDRTALAVLVVGVLTWTTVVLMSLRSQSRR